MKNNIKKQVITGIAIGMLALGGGSAIYASEKEPTTDSVVTTGGHESHSMKMDFSSLVTEGIVSQETADKMTAFQEEQEAERHAEKEKVDAMTDEERKAYFESNDNMKQGNLFEDMVAEGIITEEEAATIEETMPAPDVTFGVNGEGIGVALESVVSQLVTDGVMDQVTADEVVAYNKANEEACKAEMDKVEAMSDEERAAYAESNEGVKHLDPISDMVTEGIITEGQGNAIKEVMPNGPKETHFMAKGMEKDFTSLVADGVISQETSDKMSAYQTEIETTHQAEMDKVDAMTDAERAAYFEDEKEMGSVNPLTDMVNTGVITQAEADAIRNVSGV